MHDAERVRLGQRAAHAARQLDDHLPRQRTVRDEPLVQALARQQLHHEVERSVGRFAGVVRDDRVRIAELRERGDLALEARGHRDIGGERGVHDLDRDLAARDEIERVIDRAEAAGRDLVVESVAVPQTRAEPRIHALDHGAVEVDFRRHHALLDTDGAALLFIPIFKSGCAAFGDRVAGIFGEEPVRPRAALRRCCPVSWRTRCCRKTTARPGNAHGNCAKSSSAPWFADCKPPRPSCERSPSSISRSRWCRAHSRALLAAAPAVPDRAAIPPRRHRSTRATTATTAATATMTTTTAVTVATTTTIAAAAMTTAIATSRATTATRVVTTHLAASSRGRRCRSRSRS